MRPRLVLLFAVIAVLLAVATVAPSPGGTVDVDAETTATWTSYSRSWSLSTPTATAEDSTLLNLRGFLRNTLFFGEVIDHFSSDSQALLFTLEKGGEVVSSHRESTGEGGFLGSDKTVRVTFLQVPRDDYTIRARIIAADGATLAEASTTLSLRGSGGA